MFIFEIFLNIVTWISYSNIHAQLSQMDLQCFAAALYVQYFIEWYSPESVHFTTYDNM